MIRSIDPVCCAVVSGGVVWLGCLWLGVRCRVDCRSLRVGGLVLATAVLFLPVGGTPLWNWLFSFCPNPSLPLVGMVALALWRQLLGGRIFGAGDWTVVWAFGAAAGTLLYLHPLLPQSWDLYYIGWQHPLAVWGMAGLALAAFAGGSRAGVLVLVALVAYELSVLESPNAWDYLVDPFYWMLSLGVLASRSLRGLRRMRARVTADSRPPLPAVGLNQVVGK